MNKIENTNSKVATGSDLSEWIGPEVLLEETQVHIPRSMRNLVEPDVFDWTQRLFSLDEIEGFPNGYSVGPTVGIVGDMQDAFDILRGYDVIRTVLRKYFALSYDSIDVRFTVSDPKNLVGALHVGWIPYQDWYDKNPEETMAVIVGSEYLLQGFVNGPYTHLLTLGMSQDVSFTIPWSFKTPIITTEMIADQDSSDPDRRPLYGTPCIWWASLPGVSYITTVSNPASLRVFVKFNNLRFYGPNNNAIEAVSQSGLEVVAAAEVAASVAATLGAESLVENAIDMFVGKEEVEELADFGTYDRPQAVQLAYFGDTTSCDFPNTTPIFSPHLNMASPPILSVHEMLKRPQYIGYFLTGSGDQVYNNDPMRFHTAAGAAGNSTANYFRYFGLINRYWRGSLNFHFIVAGHPMVQVQFSSYIKYPNALVVPAQLMGSFARHLTTFPSSKHIVVPVPFVSVSDYIPVQDAYPYDQQPSDAYTTTIVANTRVISTMLDVAPVIPTYVYVSAGPDFAFYSPIPPGLYNASELAPSLDIVSQIYLPMNDQQEVARTRSMVTSDPGTHVSLPTVFDYMKLWSRAVPFVDYEPSTEEPIPDAGVGFANAYWFPPVDRSEDLDANNSWFFTLDYVAYLSSLFLLYKGEMGFKVALATTGRPQGGYVYVSLGDPIVRQQTHVPFPYSVEQVPPQSNFGAGTVITPTSKQPVLEFTLPYRGVNVWSFASYHAYTRVPATNHRYFPNALVNHNVTLLDEEGELNDAMFRKVGPNFALAIETGLPPPTMWAARGFDWSV
jgi:hypothetical protein